MRTSTPPSLRRAATLTVVLVALAGCSVQSATKVGTKPLAKGETLEFDFEMHEGAGVAFAWTSDHPVHFNVHSHEASGVHDWISTTTVAGNGTWVAPRDGTFSFFWENTSDATARVTYDLQGNAKAH